MNRLLYTFILASLLIFTSCDGLFGGKTSDNDSITVPVDSVNIGEQVVKGVAVDGSRRNIYIASGSDTLDFELSPDIDFSWEIGDSIYVKFVTTEYGDSVTYISTELV